MAALAPTCGAWSLYRCHRPATRGFVKDGERRPKYRCSVCLAPMGDYREVSVGEVMAT